MISTQTAIVGAGYTGLSAALHLAGLGHDTVIIDAETPGWGASGRSGGQVIAGLKGDPDALDARFGPAVTAAVSAAPDLVFNLIARHAIPCAPVRAGWLQLATSPRTAAALVTRARQWQARGVPIELLDHAATARLTGSPIYHSATLDPRGGTIHPLAYAHGLAGAATRAGARLFAHTPATALTRAGHAWLIETPAGAITAATVILATNAYTGRLHDPLRRSIVAIPSCQIATAPLPPDLRPHILPAGQSASDTRRLLRYFRLSPDHRLLIGSRGARADPPPQHAIRRLQAALAEIFPQAAAIPIDHAWAGLVAITPDHLPHLHEPAPGLLAALGYNGRGIAMATALGQELARRATRAPPESLTFPATPLRPIPLHAATRQAAQITIQYLRFRDALSP